MTRTIMAAGLAALALALAIGGASGHGLDAQEDRAIEFAEAAAVEGGQRAGETLWIYTEDFEDPFADDWTVLDRSGTVAQDDYWHIDTIRPKDGPGDHSWWCGTYSACWPQPRGYANDWYQVLSRHFTGVTGTGPETVEIEFDQRYAMEATYDYGYVDISDDGGDSWVTLASYTNRIAYEHGTPIDWDDPTYGHVVLDMSSYSGSDIDIRFRFESDGAVSSADEVPFPPEEWDSVLDGAWQIDNFTITVDDVATFYDDCEGGDTGWTHDPFPGEGQTGVVWWRGQYGIDFDTGWPSIPGEPPIGEYMYVPVDPGSGTMVDLENTWLISPPIYIGEAVELVSEWTGWIDLPNKSNDYFDIWVGTSNDIYCVSDPWTLFDADPGFWSGGPFWATVRDDWTSLAGSGDYLVVAFKVWNEAPPSGNAEHAGGFFLNSLKVGIPMSTGVVEAGFTNRLSHASPNPFNPATRIAYSVKDAGPVAIEVYNVAGKVVRTLLDAELEAGAKGEIAWDGADDLGEKCASGVYFYRISAPGYNETKKMIMLK
jgi:hypothetical protein